MLRGSRAFSGKIHPQFLAQVVPHFTTRGLWWRYLAVQVGTTKDQGLYNKPSAVVHPGVLTAWTLPQDSNYVCIYVLCVDVCSFNTAVASLSDHALS